MSLFCCPSCGLPAEDVRHFVVESSDGPIEYFLACCIQMHRFTLPASTVAETIEVEAAVPEPGLDALEATGPPINLAYAPPVQSVVAATPKSMAATPEPDSGLVHLPPPHTTVDTLWAPRSRLAAGAFFAGGLSSGFLLKVPAVMAFAIILGLMAVAVIASLIPMALSSRRFGRGQIAPLSRRTSRTTGANSSSDDHGQQAA
jgi:hypothetical protein